MVMVMVCTVIVAALRTTSQRANIMFPYVNVSIPYHENVLIT